MAYFKALVAWKIDVVGTQKLVWSHSLGQTHDGVRGKNPQKFWAALVHNRPRNFFFHFYVVVYSAAQEWDEKKYQQRF